MQRSVIMKAETKTSYDEVGKYQQDKVNGLNNKLLDKFITLANIRGGETILDAMAGDGNLSERIFSYCNHNNIPLPSIRLLEYSKVQTKHAKETLKGLPADIIWGDILSMKNLKTDTTIQDDTFDIVFIKSANHEIPLEKQNILYENIFRVLKPGGVFINLGFLFDCSVERDEFREIARTKDKLANMMEAYRNRYFLTKEEFYANLHNVGFKKVVKSESFNYSIRSSEVAKQYSKKGEIDQFNIRHQLAQVTALNMRKHGRIYFEPDALPWRINCSYKA